MKLKKLYILNALLIVIMLTLFTNTSSAATQPSPKLGKDGQYHIYIVAHQWEYKAMDLVSGQVYYHRIGSFLKGSNITITVASMDVQHGFSIQVGPNEQYSIATIRPVGNQATGTNQSISFQWPNKDTTISAFCNIFCGLGHPDMKLKFVIGNGTPNYGLYVLYFAYIVNFAVVVIALRSIIVKHIPGV